MTEEEKKAEPYFVINSISISPSYQHNGMFSATCKVKNKFSGATLELVIPPERVLPLIDAVSDLIVEELKGQFSNMREEAQHLLQEHQQKLLEQSGVTVDANV